MRNPRTLAWSLAVMLALPTLCAAQGDGELQKLKRKRLKDDAADFWIYDDVQAGYAQAKATGKPLLVSFRCVP